MATQWGDLCVAPRFVELRDAGGGCVCKEDEFITVGTRGEETAHLVGVRKQRDAQGLQASHTLQKYPK